MGIGREDKGGKGRENSYLGEPGKWKIENNNNNTQAEGWSVC